MTAMEIARREIAESYTTKSERAAYRAGLSTAAAICDEHAARVKAQNPGRRKGEASQVGQFGFDVATSCADAISALRSEINMPD